MQLHTTRAAVRKRARYHLAAALFDKAPSAPARTGLRGNGRTRRRLGPQAAALTDKAPGPCSPVRQAPPFSKTEALCRPFAAGYSSLLSLFQNFLCFLYYRKPRRSCQVPKVARMRPPRASERLPHALEPARFCPCQRRSSSAPQALRLRLLCPARAVPSAVFLPTLLPFHSVFRRKSRRAARTAEEKPKKVFSCAAAGIFSVGAALHLQSGQNLL